MTTTTTTKLTAYLTMMCKMEKHDICKNDRCDCLCHKEVRTHEGDAALATFGFEMWDSKHQMDSEALQRRVIWDAYQAFFAETEVNFMALTFACLNATVRPHWSMREFLDDYSAELERQNKV